MRNESLLDEINLVVGNDKRTANSSICLMGCF